jgi:hypothetical protein
MWDIHAALWVSDGSEITALTRFLCADRHLHSVSAVNLRKENPSLVMALEIIQSAKSLGLSTLPEATLKRLAGLMNQLGPQHKLCVFHGIANMFDHKTRWKS